jgi:Kef-type K+ transport system membrane component KefB
MAGGAGVLAPLLPALTVVLIVAHLLGALADRVGFVPVVGELLTGLVLGPSILGVLAPGVAALVVPVPAGLEALSSLGLVLLLVLAGTEVDVAALRESLRPTVALATGAFLVPFTGGVALGYLLPGRYLAAPGSRGPFALLLGTALAISAVPVAVRVLVDLDAMDRPVGQLTLTAAVVVDAIGWIALTVVFQLARDGGTDPLAVGRTVLVLAAFGGLVLAVGPAIARSVFAAATRVRSPVLTGFSAVVALGVGAAATALALGLEPILGAFLAGVVVRPALDADSARVFEVATLGLFAPLFFATAGLRVDLSGVVDPEVLVVGAVTLAVAVAGKALGVAVGAAVTELSAEETVCLAIGLNARGAMEIVVAALGLSVGLFSPTMYAVIVLVAIVTSVVTPPLLRRALARLPESTAEPTVETEATTPGDP